MDNIQSGVGLIRVNVHLKGVGVALRGTSGPPQPKPPADWLRWVNFAMQAANTLVNVGRALGWWFAARPEVRNSNPSL